MGIFKKKKFIIKNKDEVFHLSKKDPLLEDIDEEGDDFFFGASSVKQQNLLDCVVDDDGDDCGDDFGF